MNEDYEAITIEDSPEISTGDHTFKLQFASMEKDKAVAIRRATISYRRVK